MVLHDASIIRYNATALAAKITSLGVKISKGSVERYSGVYKDFDPPNQYSDYPVVIPGLLPRRIVGPREFEKKVIDAWVEDSGLDILKGQLGKRRGFYGEGEKIALARREAVAARNRSPEASEVPEAPEAPEAPDLPVIPTVNSILNQLASQNEMTHVNPGGPVDSIAEIAAPESVDVIGAGLAAFYWLTAPLDDEAVRLVMYYLKSPQFGNLTAEKIIETKAYIKVLKAQEVLKAKGE